MNNPNEVQFIVNVFNKESFANFLFTDVMMHIKKILRNPQYWYFEYNKKNPLNDENCQCSEFTYNDVSEIDVINTDLEIVRINVRDITQETTYRAIDNVVETDELVYIFYIDGKMYLSTMDMLDEMYDDID